MTRQCSRSADLRDPVRPPFSDSRWGARVFVACSVALVVAAAYAFYEPARRLCHGLWPAPLDDVYIHFDFARSAARGHPFSWVPGNGYSSGGTSLTYPLVLALGYLVGFRGDWLGVFAAAVAVASLIDGCLSLRALVEKKWIAFVAPLLLLSIPLLDWTWFSGMEVAFASALLLRALRCAGEAAPASPHNRKSHQLRAGIYLALLCVTRPECAVLAVVMAVAITHAAGALGTLVSLARSLGPTVLMLGAQALANLYFTGELAAAGAVRKLITQNPYASGPDIAILFLTNLSRLHTEGIELAFGGSHATWLVIALALVGVADRRLGRFSVALLVGAVGALALVCFNTTAPFQNMRYVAPTLFMLLVGAFLGLSVLSQRGRVGKGLAVALTAAIVGLAAPAWPRQIDHFARASRNIAEQQVVVGRRLAELPEKPRRVFVGDAGAIPYESDLPALDGLGLGGYHDLPFARASVLGGPAVLELIERMPASQRPDVLAVYDTWWPDLVPAFGEPLFSVTIEDNVICGDNTKSVYRADWSLLEDRNELQPLDRVDVGDLVDEADHAFVLPGPHTGYVIGATLEDDRGTRRFDAGRIVPDGSAMSVVIRGTFPSGPHFLVLTTDGGPPLSVDLAISSASQQRIELADRPSGRWANVRVSLPNIGPGSTLTFRPVGGALRAFAISVVH